MDANTKRRATVLRPLFPGDLQKWTNLRKAIKIPHWTKHFSEECVAYLVEITELNERLTESQLVWNDEPVVKDQSDCTEFQIE